MYEKREHKGIELVLKGHVTQISAREFKVLSENANGTYKVSWEGKRWSCTCPDFIQRRRKCKHIYAVCYFLSFRDLQAGVKRTSDLEKCPQCNTDDMVIKDGFSESRSGLKQRYYCKRCRLGFTSSTGFEGIHGQAIAILISLDLYYRGLSLRQIAEHLQSVYNITVSHGTIYGWIKRYVSIVSEYLNRLNMKVRERLHADDTMVRVKGRHLTIWGMLDSETRLLIAKNISNCKDAKEAFKLLKQGLAKSSVKPLEVVTDSAPQYASAIDKISCKTDQLIHLQTGISTPLTNNKMERFFRTLKQRYKTINSFQSKETAETFLNGFQIFYNFLKSHRALDGKTPAEVASLSDDKVNWLYLIKKANKIFRVP
ncbi:MAG: IS6 family transposase [Nitrososphaeria archaeon]